MASENEVDAVKPVVISKRDFLLGSLGIVSLGMILGVRRAMKKDTYKTQIHSSSIMMAMRALGYGTMLCFGTATLGVVTFSVATGIRSTEEFAKKSKELLRDLKISRPLTKEEQEQLQRDEAELMKSVEGALEIISKDAKNKIGSILDSSKESKDNSSAEEKKSEQPVEITSIIIQKLKQLKLKVAGWITNKGSSPNSDQNETDQNNDDRK